MIKKHILKTAYRLGGFRPFHLAVRHKVLILTYHRFSSDIQPLKVSADEFYQHLKYLKKIANVVSLAEVVEAVTYGKPLPPNATAITIDDGYRDAFEVAFPLLREFCFPATLFVVTDFVDGNCWLWTDLMRFILLNADSSLREIDLDGEVIKLEIGSEWQRLETAQRINTRLKRVANNVKDDMIGQIALQLGVEIPAAPTEQYAPITWDQALEMDSNDLRIESHSVTHPILTNIDPSELDFQLHSSRERLESVLNRGVRYFCYPNGALDDSVRSAVEKAGYAGAVTTRYGFAGRGADPFLLSRIDAPAAIENFAQSVSGFEAIRHGLSQ